jgi:hypothetical protein
VSSLLRVGIVGLSRSLITQAARNFLRTGGAHSSAPLYPKFNLGLLR